jgi:3-hydroxyacyl-CoA dehydrogenase
VPVLVGVCYGFVGNRMLHQRGLQAEKLILEGALPHQVDKVLTDFGFPMGPFAMGDLAGLDVGWRIRKGRGAKSPVADRICELGRFGQKTGSGLLQVREGRSHADSPTPRSRRSSWTWRPSRASRAATSPTRRSSSACSTRW